MSTNPKATFVSNPDGNVSLAYDVLNPDAQDSFLSQIDVRQNQQQISNYNLPQTNEAGVSAVFHQRVLELQKTLNRDMRRPPRVGRKELDMYQLFVSVQQRGGYTAIQQWKNLARDLSLPSSVTNAGFVLRSKYDSFIRPFEDQLIKEFCPNFPAKPAQPIITPDPNNYIMSQAECQQQQELQQQQYQQTYQKALQNQIQQQLQNMKQQRFQKQFQQPQQILLKQNKSAQQIARPQIDRKMSNLKNLVIEDADLTNVEFQNLLLQNPNLVRLSVGSLKDITQVPYSFPQNLKYVELFDVPFMLVKEMMEVLGQLDIEDIKITQFRPEKPKTQQQPQQQQQPPQQKAENKNLMEVNTSFQDVNLSTLMSARQNYSFLNNSYNVDVNKYNDQSLD